MKWLGVFFRIVTSVLFLAAALSLIVIIWLPEDFRQLAVQKTGDYLLYTPIYISILPGLVLVLIWLLGVVPLFSRKKVQSVTAFTSTSGAVEISVQAVKDFTRRACREVQGVRDVPEVRVNQSRNGGVSLWLRVVLSQYAPVEAMTTCQERVRQGLAASLGLEDVREVTVFVDHHREEAGGGSRSQSSESPHPHTSMFPAFQREESSSEEEESEENKKEDTTSE
jgi:uncharacterized alkaline shock family protein YloU